MATSDSIVGNRNEALILLALVVAAHVGLLVALAPAPASSTRPRSPMVVELLAAPAAQPAATVEQPPARSIAPRPAREPQPSAERRARQPQAAAPTGIAGDALRVPADDASRGTSVPAASTPSAAPSESAVAGSASSTRSVPASSTSSAAAPSAPPEAVAAPTPITPPRYDAPQLHNPSAEYPLLARRLGEQGRVLLRVFVTSAGVAEKVEVQTSSGSPRLDRAARETVARWQFVPARRGEEPVAAWLLVPIVFKLEG